MLARAAAPGAAERGGYGERARARAPSGARQKRVHVGERLALLKLQRHGDNTALTRAPTLALSPERERPRARIN